MRWMQADAPDVSTGEHGLIFDRGARLWCEALAASDHLTRNRRLVLMAACCCRLADGSLLFLALPCDLEQAAVVESRQREEQMQQLLDSERVSAVSFQDGRA